jgi:hypothetical protein
VKGVSQLDIDSTLSIVLQLGPENVALPTRRVS